MMWNRCTNEKSGEFSRYGGRGIQVCDRWRTFEAFLADMGERPAGTSIDRIDNERGYEPGNCRWATDTEQNRNRRFVKLDEVSAMLIRHIARRGSRHADIAHAFGVSRTAISHVVSRKTWA